MKSRSARAPEPPVPSPHNWRTTDEDELNRRRMRAREETFRIRNLDPRHPIFSNFSVESGSGLSYSVEVRDVRNRQFACECVDFRVNGLGTCKHVEAVLLYLDGRYAKLFRAAAAQSSTRLEVLPDPSAGTLRLSPGSNRIPVPVARWFPEGGRLKEADLDAAVNELKEMGKTAWPALRVSQEVGPWLEERKRAEERKSLRRFYEARVQSGEWPAHETTVPLFPYQREGMLHLAFTERALLADEMGLGKTIQAIAACALLHRLGKAKRVLVVTPASLKTEWEEQIQRFTTLPYQLVYGNRSKRLLAYGNAPFFTIVNYEQMLADSLNVNQHLGQDVVVLDEAQRIKNWDTKIAQAVKRLQSRYAFVLTGTPIENRIDEIHSLMNFLNPAVLGPLFRFNRDFYDLDERGRPVGYRQLDQLHARIKPYLLRRRKADVETELPDRTDRNHFVKLSDLQAETYQSHAKQVLRLVNIANRRPLSKPEQDKLQRELAMMRMICDTNYILDPNDQVCPKLAELEKLLEECLANDAKVIIFSEWERMLELAKRLCERMEIGFAWHTGSVPQKRRRAEINLFKNDPACRVFLSTDSGATGLNLQNASVVINCDLPWNPAKLEQRIARAWRKNQTRAVSVFNLVSEGTIEHRMLDTLAVKQAVAESVLDFPGKVKEIKIRGSRQAFLERLRQMLSPTAPDAAPVPPKAPLPTDRAAAFAQIARQKINGAMIRCEERYPREGAHSVVFVVVERDPETWRARLASVHDQLFGPEQSDPLAPTRLEVIDRATDEAIQRMIQAGLLAKADRAIRPLEPGSGDSAPPPLTPEEKAKAAAERSKAQRKLKMARLLASGDLAEESRASLLETVLPLARALAIENRLPEPTGLEEALLPPMGTHWKNALSPLRSFLADPNQPVTPLCDLLGAL